MNKRSLQVNDLDNIHVLQDQQISPDGTFTVYVRKQIINDTYYSQLFVQKFDEPLPVQWTFGEGTVHTPRISPDGNWIAFTSSQDKGSLAQLDLISTKGGEARKMTELKGGAVQPVWAPDSSEVFFNTSHAPEGEASDTEASEEKSQPLIVERLKYKSDAEGFLTSKKKQIASLSVDLEEVTIFTRENYDLELTDVSPDNNFIIYTANKEDDKRIGSDLFLYNRNTKEHRKILTGAFSSARYSNDGRKIAVYGHEQEFKGATQMKVWVYDIDAETALCLTNHKDIGFSDTMIGDIRGGMTHPGPYWNHTDSALYVLGSYHGNTHLYEITMDGTITQKTYGEQHVYSFAVDTSLDIAVLGISTPVNPGELYLGSLKKEDYRLFTHFHEEWKKEVHLFEPEEVWCEAEDGWKLQGWIIKPLDQESSPGILEIHGGPHAMYGNTFFHELQLFVSEGYTVFYCNPRGSHGYGQEFVNAVRGDYGGKDYQDIMTFTDAVLDTYKFIDKERLGVTGGSYGGFMTNWITAHTNRFKAAATLRCISNWTSFYGVSDIGYYFTEWEVGSDLLDDPDKLWHHSPLKYVKNIHTPLLIMHGENDLRCPIEQAEQLFVALKQLDRSTRFVRFPEANHELSRSGPPHLRKERLKELIFWFKQI
ncbi:S9 family peptidase [Alkalicoccus daliensis]|uniref:Dipeptidyl aminopeptidase/acylaminoacyl peptidase n=1 Tax=Alkalicoccus daliensis TaxID=745820 RepID=A0A1H0BHM1_9BACI|nr:S9 family peptidase [Alkalicoccus daliensis]SDN45156.1 Dipeptidyl aminopeptidase/acylaminoacyl peptidase [Alkalicoccus daliensis]